MQQKGGYEIAVKKGVNAVWRRWAKKSMIEDSKIPVNLPRIS